MTDEQLTPMEEARRRVEQAKYADTELEPYIVFIKRWDKEAEIHRYNPYMTVDGRVKELVDGLPDGQTFSIRTYFNTGDHDQFVENFVIPARSCVAILTDPGGGVHFGTASIGSTGMVDKTNAIENAETSAVGRALGLAGYGLIPGAGIASAEEMTDALGRERASNDGDDWRSWPMSRLGEHKIAGRGWGKEGRFPGWTLQEVYDDEDGHSAMAWADGLDDPKGITAMMARYFNLREGQQEEARGEVPDGVSLQEFDQQVTSPPDGVVLIAGRKVSANEQLSPEWAQWVAKRAAQLTGEDGLFRAHKHLINHLKAHYSVAKIMDMSGVQAAAFVRYMQSGGKDKDPAYYKSDEEELFGSQSLDDLLRKAAPNLAPPHGDDPQGWFKQTCEAYGIGPMLNPKQLDSMRRILQLISTGTINLREIAEAGGKEDDPMFRTLCESLRKVAQNGK
jgi:hypothetical protein